LGGIWGTEPGLDPRSFQHLDTQSLHALEPAAVGGLFRAVAADRHDAPSPRAPARVVGEQHGAVVPLARLDVRKVLVATNFAMASPTGSNSASGDRQRRLIRNARAPPS